MITRITDFDYLIVPYKNFHIDQDLINSLLAGIDEKRPLPAISKCFLTTEEIYDLLAYYGIEKTEELAITNPNRLAEKCADITALPHPRPSGRQKRQTAVY